MLAYPYSKDRMDTIALANTYLALIMGAVDQLDYITVRSERTKKIVEINGLLRDSKPVFDETGDPYYREAVIARINCR
jgi:hypothetical protein